MQLFWEQGYEATALSDIIDVTGLGKASLYKAFGNKHEMYLKALKHYEVIAVDRAIKKLRAKKLSPLERIDDFLSGENPDRRGCFLCNSAADRASLDRDVDALVLRGYSKLRSAIVEVLREQDPDIISQSVKTCAQLILTIYAGLRIMARTGMEAEAIASAKSAALEDLRTKKIYNGT
jgi:AcrR family transcriptional regulator